MPPCNIAQFKMLSPQVLGKALRGRFQSLGGKLAVRGNPTVGRKWQADQGMAKQQTFNLRQRQDAFDDTGIFGIQEVGFVPEHLAQYALPPRAVEKCSLSTAQHKGIPALGRIDVCYRQSSDLNHGSVSVQGGIGIGTCKRRRG